MKQTPRPLPGHTPHRTHTFLGRQVVKASAIARDSVALHPLLVNWARQSQLARITGLPLTGIPRRGK